MHYGYYILDVLDYTLFSKNTTVIRTTSFEVAQMLNTT